MSKQNRITQTYDEAWTNLFAELGVAGSSYPTFRAKGGKVVATCRTVAELDQFLGSDLDAYDWESYAQLAQACAIEIRDRNLLDESALASDKKRGIFLGGEMRAAQDKAQRLYERLVAEVDTQIRNDERQRDQLARSYDGERTYVVGGDVRGQAPRPAARAFIRDSDGRPAAVERSQRFAEHPVVFDTLRSRAAHEDGIVNRHGTFGQMVRAMSTSGGSAIVPTIWIGDLIDRARNVSAVLQAGAQIVPMDAKTVQIGRLTADPTAAFRAEGSAITASDPTFDNVTLDSKTMSALTIGSLEWFQDAENVDEVVSNAIAQAIATNLDLAALYGSITTGAGAINLPTPPNPRGVLGTLLALAPSSVLGAATNGTAQTATSYFNELLDLVFTPQDYNEQPTALIWNAKAARQYAKAYDTTGQPLQWPQVLADLKRFTTNQVPSYTQGTMANRATDAFVGDWQQLLIGQRLELTIQVLTERYAENGQIGIVAHWRGDVGVARPRAFAVYRALQGA